MLYYPHKGVITLNERIKKLRRVFDLTQQEFAEKIGTARNNIAGYETGKRSPSEAVISLICKTFNVNETWLRTGEGEMLQPNPTSALDALAAEYSLSSSDYILIEKFLALKPETRNAVTDYMREVVASITSMEAEASSPVEPASLPSSTAQTVEDEARAEAEEYYRRLVKEKRQASPTSAVKERDAV